MNTEKRNKLNPTLTRFSPILYFYTLLLYCIIKPSYYSLYLFISFNIIGISNILLKYISKSIYSLFNIETIPLLGIGKRPENAINCGTYLDGVPSTTYGMPSGHSQFAWAVAIYFILKIIKKSYNKTQHTPIKIFGYMWLILSCIIILGIATYISYSRVYIEGCHTIQQVIIGGIIGCVMGFLVFFFENPVINLLSSIY